MLTRKKKKDIQILFEQELWRVFEEEPDMLAQMMFYMKENLSKEEQDYLETLDFTITVKETV